ncbi:major facilitator superfamily domain-containing protein 1 isoform X1 [Dendroctonus ponderosae]|uniref:major facilitator superfamily domain-containing protein 1 isoform X1 n=1 Tax=Dendroctonus ponderosae TaxID=77166 RepID=UPI002035CC39|nr:major facilitator superfamily domain-containing protein 1 isoform X1 [Dendroctonus ponderosae]
MEGGPNIQVAVEDEETCCDRAYHLCCHPSGKAHRFLALIFMCILGFGSYFCYDNPSALQKQFKQDLNLTETQFTALYSVYSWPNVVMCFVGGFLIDQVFGIRAGANIFMGLTLIGQLLFTAAVYVNQYWLMILGRFVFGVGSESLAVAQNNYAVLWFKGKELNMVFGLQMSIARMGSTVNFWLMEPIYQWVSTSSTGTKILGLSLLIASATCLFSTICSLILGYMDKRAERMTRRSEARTTEAVRITDAKHFKGTFWLVTCICVTYYNAIFPFISLAQQFFIQRFRMNVKDADHISSLIYLISGIISPFTGFLIDKIGLNILWILISTVGTIIAHLLLGFTACDPYIGVIILGVAYSVLASGLWPLVAVIIPEYQLGTAYGVCQAVQNLGLAIVSIITGSIVDKWGFRVLSMFFLGNLFMAFMFTSILLIIDQRERGVLNLTPGGRKKHQEVILEEIVQRQRLLSAEQLPVDVEAPAQESADNNSGSDDTRLRNRYISAVDRLSS